MISFQGRKVGPVIMAGCMLIGMLLLCGLGIASEGGAHDSAPLYDLGKRFLNFALLVIILFVVIRKTAIKDFFAARREEIKKNFDSLKSDRDAAESRYRELEKKLEEFEIKKEEIIEQFKKEGNEEKERIVAEAQQRAKQILDQADLAIEREIRAAGERLKQEVVDIAAQKAQEIIVREIKDSDQDNLVNEFIEEMEKLN